jgi:glycosyltransferase involved in cell wall biosynthesis
VAGDAALLVDPFTVDSIAGALTKMHSAPALRQELITKGFQNTERFSWDQSAEKLWQIVAEAANGTSAA